MENNSLNHTKLLELYQRITPEDLKRMAEIVVSPFFNKQEAIVTMHDFLENHYPDFPDKEVNKITLFKHVFPNQAYNDQKLRNVMSGLVRLVKEYLAIRSFQGNEADKKRHELQSLSDRNAERNLTASLNEFDRLNKDEVFKESDSVSWLGLESEISRQRVREAERQNRMAVSTKLEIIDKLDQFFIQEKLKYACASAGYATVLSGEWEMKFLDEIIQYIREHDLSEQPVTLLYYHILMTMTEEDSIPHFNKARSLFDEHVEHLNHDESQEIFTYILNYCIRKINQGEANFVNEAFELYRFALEKEIIMDDKNLSPFHYKNIVVIGLRAGESKWVKQFIKQYLKLLPKADQENARTYNLAKYHFYEENYSEVISLLSRVEYSDVFYGLDSKAMLLKTYFELDELEALYSLIESFRTLLRRKKLISEHHRKNYSNLIKFTRRLSRIHPRDYKKLKALKKQIKETKQIADVGWLLSKVEELLPAMEH